MKLRKLFTHSGGSRHVAPVSVGARLQQNVPGFVAYPVLFVAFLAAVSTMYVQLSAAGL